MVRAFFPHASPGSIKTNTNYPPQNDNQGGTSSKDRMIFNITGEIMLFNNTGEIMEYNT